MNRLQSGGRPPHAATAAARGCTKLPAWTALALLVAVGLGVGLLAGLFGVGGGILAVPALGLLLGLDQHAAAGTSLAMMLPTVALGAWRYARAGSVRWRAAAYVGLTAVAFSFGAAHLALLLPARTLRLLFGLFLLLVGWRTVKSARTPPDAGARPSPRRPAVPQIGIGALVGCVAGLLGVGGGTIAIPGLMLLCGFGAQAAQGTSLAALALSSAAGAAGYASAGQVDWVGAGALFIGAAATVPLGAAAAHRLPERALRLAFGMFAAVVAILELVHAIGR